MFAPLRQLLGFVFVLSSSPVHILVLQLVSTAIVVFAAFLDLTLFTVSCTPERTFAISYAAIGFDILTDLMSIGPSCLSKCQDTYYASNLNTSPRIMGSQHKTSTEA